jgi:hypothetical protein
MDVDDQKVEVGVMSAGSGRPPASRRSFLTGTGAVAGAAAVAGLFGGPLAQRARAAEPGCPPASYAPIPKSALGPPLNADGYFVGQIKGDLYWVTDSAYQANANRWPRLGSLTCSTVTRRSPATRRPSRCSRPTSGPVMPKAASLSGSIRRPSGSTSR